MNNHSRAEAVNGYKNLYRDYFPIRSNVWHGKPRGVLRRLVLHPGRVFALGPDDAELNERGDVVVKF